MQQVHNNLIILNVGDMPTEVMVNSCLSIYIDGSMSMTDNLDWTQKFINGLAILSNPQTGDERFKKFRFMVYNPRYKPQNATPDLKNPEFVNVNDWKLNSMAQAQACFFNFLKKSQSPAPLFSLGILCGQIASGVPNKTIIRCPVEYMSYPTVKYYSNKYGIPCFNSNLNVKTAIESFFQLNETFNSAMRMSLGNN